MTNGQLTQLQWVGVGFVAFLVLFFVVAYFKRPTGAQESILRFLAGLCAGFAGGIFVGEAAFKTELPYAGAKLGISGTAGFALFFVVWFTWRLALPDAFNFSVPQGWTFGAAVQAMAQAGNLVPNLVGFSKEQLETKLRAAEVHSQNVKAALAVVRSLADQPLPEYEVTVTPPAVTLKAKSK